jgi:multiple sugar transport system permease protein
MSVRADTLVLASGPASRRWRQAVIGMGLLLPSAALVLAFTIFPVAYNVWLGFYSKHSLRATSTWVGLGNYLQILADADFWRSVWLATVYAIGSTALQIVAGVAGALILHKRFAGCDFLRGVALFPYMIPTVIAVFVWRWPSGSTSSSTWRWWTGA